MVYYLESEYERIINQESIDGMGDNVLAGLILILYIFK